MTGAIQTAKDNSGDITVKLISSFKELIADGTFVPGCRLPPERELAKRLGVNRSSLRQALKVLQLMGFLRQRVGDGTYLNTDANSAMQEPIEFMILMGDITDEELFDARLIVETELAARAAERATAKDLTVLQQAIKRMEQSRTDEDRLEADLAFHQAIFQASGNRACRIIFAVIHRAILRSMARIVKRSGVGRPLGFHKRIYAAIYGRDSNEAREQMKNHLLDTKSQLHGQLQAKVNLAHVRPIVSRRQLK